MSQNSPTPDGLAIAPNAPATVNDPAASNQELQEHRFWGRWDTAADLPNASGNAAGSPAYDKMRPGDKAWVGALLREFVLEDRGTLSGADAVWREVPQGPDAFGPTIVVGNTAAGDPAVGKLAPFRYIPDPGDGSGIATALAEASAAGGLGWVHIRRGSYLLDLPGSPALPLTIDGTRVTGDGNSTFLSMSASDRRVFAFTSVPPASTTGRPATLERLAIGWKAAAPGAVGTDLIDASACPRAVIEEVEVINTAAPAENGDETLTTIFHGGNGVRFVNCRGINIDGNTNITVVCFRLASPGGVILNCVASGSNVGARLQSFFGKVRGLTANGGTLFATATGIEASVLGVDIAGCNIVSVTDGVVLESGAKGVVRGNVFGAGLPGDGIRVEAGATDCVVIGNVLNGNPFVDAGTGTEAGHNTP